MTEVLYSNVDEVYDEANCYACESDENFAKWSVFRNFRTKTKTSVQV